MTYRGGLIGCGRIGAGINPPGVGASRLGSHAAGYAASNRVALVAACDPDESRRLEAARRWNIPHVYATVDEMLARETLDVISVASPADGRGDLLARLIGSGRVKAILAEKPLAETADAAAEIAALASRSGVVGAVNYVRRFSPAYRAAAADVRAGKLGDMQLVRGIYTKGILNNGSHMLDLLRMFFGDAADVAADSAVEEIPGDPTVAFTARYAAGFTASIAALRHDAHTIFELDMIGTRGRILIGDLGHRIQRWDVADTMKEFGFIQLASQPASSDADLTGAIGAAIDNLAGCLESGASPHCTFEDGRAALALALAVRDRAAAAARAPVTT